MDDDLDDKLWQVSPPELSSVEDGWDMLERYWDSFRRLCAGQARRVMGPRSPMISDLVDELMGELVDRVPLMLDNWDPTIGVTARAYVFRLSRAYVRKRLCNGSYSSQRWERRRLHGEAAADALRSAVSDNFDGDDRLQVFFIMEGLSEGDRYILAMRASGMTWEEMAYELDCSRNTAKHMWHDAITAAQDVVNYRSLSA